MTIAEKAGSVVSFDLVSNSAWNISGIENWATVSDEAGINDKTITLTAMANPLTQRRSQTLKVFSPGAASETITITQLEALPMLSISPESLIVNAGEGSTASLMIISNTSWTLKCSEPWLLPGEAKGDRFGRVVFTASENNGSTERKAKITLSANGLTPKIISVIQKPAETK